MAKSTKIIAALGVVAGLGVAAMPLATFAADPQPVRELTDTLSVVISPSCSFTSSTYEPAESAATGSWTNGSVTVNNGNETGKASNSFSATIPAAGGSASGTHTMSMFCNNSKGFQVKVNAPASLTSGSDAIAYKYNLGASNDEGYNIKLESTAGEALVTTTGVFETDGILANASAAGDDVVVIDGTNKQTTGTTLKATYTIGTTSSTPAGTYTGNVVYTLAVIE